jgi:hypothetical protein
MTLGMNIARRDSLYTIRVTIGAGEDMTHISLLN